MAATGYTPIQLYYSTTAAAVPTAGNLASGELAINITDGKLYYKNNSGVVTLLANTATVAPVTTFSAGTTGFTPSTATSGAVTLGGTLITSNGGTGLASYTAGDLSYYASGTALTKLAIGTAGQILTSSGTAPQWSTLSGVAVTTFSAGTTGFTPSSATAGAVTLAGTLATTNGGTGLTSFTSGGVVYASSTSALATGSALTFNGSQLLVNSNSTTASGFFQINDSTTTQANSFGTIVRNANDGNGRYSLSAWRAQNASGLTQYAYIGAQSVTGASNYTPELVFGLSTGASTYAEQGRWTTTGLGIGATATGKFLAYQATAIQNFQGAYGSSGTFQTGNGTLTLGGGANPRGIGVLINANRDVGTTLTYGNNYETFGLLAVANVGTGGGYGTTGVAGYAESDGGVYGLRADAKTTAVGGVSIAVGLYVGSVTGSSTNYGVYVNDTAASNYFGGNVGIGTTSNVYKLDVNGNFQVRGSKKVSFIGGMPPNYPGSIVERSVIADTVFTPLNSASGTDIIITQTGIGFGHWVVTVELSGDNNGTGVGLAQMVMEFDSYANAGGSNVVINPKLVNYYFQSGLYYSFSVTPNIALSYSGSTITVTVAGYSSYITGLCRVEFFGSSYASSSLSLSTSGTSSSTSWLKLNGWLQGNSTSLTQANTNILYANNSEAARFDSSGNLLVGTTTSVSGSNHVVVGSNSIQGFKQDFTNLGTTAQSFGFQASSAGVYVCSMKSISGASIAFLIACTFDNSAINMFTTSLGGCTAGGNSGTISGINGDARTYTFSRNGGTGLFEVTASSTATGTTTFYMTPLNVFA